MTELPIDHAPAARTLRPPSVRLRLRSLGGARTLAAVAVAAALVLAGCTDDGDDSLAKGAGCG